MAGYAGFGSAAYPGDACMAWLEANTNLEWCGYYLGPTSSYSGAPWMTQQAALSVAGRGLAPICVGEQIVPPGSQNPSAAKGAADGADAVQLLAGEGFARGIYVFLDLEDGSLPQALAAGGFQPGVYCFHAIAGQVIALRPGVPIWAFNVPTNAAHPAAGPPFRDDDPASSGYAAAQGWQLDQDSLINAAPAPAGRLRVNLSSALSANPGGPVPAA